MRSAMILAAGLGTRLRPLTDELPKPLVPIGDRPAIAHVLARLAAAGVERAVMNTHHLPAAFAELAAASPLPLEVIHEPELLGTAGGVANAASRLGNDLALVWNADVIADVDVAALLALHAQSGAAAALASAPRPIGQGTLGIDAQGRVARLREERFGHEVRGGDFLGVQLIGAALRAELPAAGCLVGDVYLPALRRGAALVVLDVPGEWDDIGTVAAYLDANLRWLAARGVAAHLGDGAAVSAGVRIVDTVIGAGAVVVGQGLLRGCVVWPGARATAPLERAVVTRGGRVVGV